MSGVRWALRCAVALFFGVALAAQAHTQPEDRFLARGTPPFVCQPGDTFGYYFYGGWRIDVPELRAPSWCGAADAAMAYADKTDTDRTRVPYRTEQCVEGQYWTYSHAYPRPTDPSYRWYSGPHHEIYMVCYVGATVITNSAPAFLLPGETGLVTSRVTKAGAPRTGVYLSNTASAGSIFNCRAWTDEEGNGSCAFTAPGEPQTVKITSMCSGCAEPAIAYVQVGRNRSDITLIGPSRTKALPAGPVLPQAAVVTRNGSPSVGIGVTVTLTDPAGSAKTFSGTTDAGGQFRFTYVPPYLRPTVESLKATCTECSNEAQKQIVVDACEVCAGSGGQ